MIAELFVEPRSRSLATALLGTDRHEVAYRRMRRLTLRRLGSRPAEFLFVQARVAVVVGIRLRNGKRVVVKVFQPGRRPSRAQRHVQRAAAAVGLPCPRPVVRRTRVWRSPAAIDEFLPGDRCGLETDELRGALARMLARFVASVGPQVGKGGRQLGAHRMPPLDGELWPVPHGFDVDFEASATEAEWIDDAARRAIEIGPRAAGDVVIGHGDWCEQNIGFDGEQVVAVYDWDDVARDREPLFVGFAAVIFCSGVRPGRDLCSGPDEARRFVDAYEQARGWRFDGAERRAVGAAALYMVAYMARCEHANEPTSAHPERSFRWWLANHGDEFLSV